MMIHILVTHVKCSYVPDDALIWFMYQETLVLKSDQSININIVSGGSRHSIWGGGGHEMRLNAMGTVRSFGGRKLIYNKIITRKI